MGFTELLDQAVTIQRATEEIDAETRESSRLFAPIATDVPAAKQQPRGRSRQREAGRDGSTIWLWFFPGGTDLRQADRVIESDGTVYRVAKVEDLRGHHVEAELELVPAGA